MGAEVLGEVVDALRQHRNLTYLQKTDLEGYRALIKELGLRR